MLHSFYTGSPVTVVDMVFLGDQRHAVNQDLIESMKFAGIVNGIYLHLYNILILSNLYLFSLLSSKSYCSDVGYSILLR